MLQRLGKSGASMPPERLMDIYAAQMRTVREWLAQRPNFAVLEVDYASIVAEPLAEAQRMADFLNLPLDVTAMAQAVDPALYRNRASSA
jgi:hypothetical protein